MDFSKDSLELSMDHSTLPKETEDKSKSNNLLSIFVCYFAVSKFKLNTLSINWVKLNFHHFWV